MTERWRCPGMGVANKTPSEEAVFRLAESLPNYPQHELTHDFVYAMIQRAFTTGLCYGRNEAQLEILKWNTRRTA